MLTFKAGFTRSQPELISVTPEQTADFLERVETRALRSTSEPFEYFAHEKFDKNFAHLEIDQLFREYNRLFPFYKPGIQDEYHEPEEYAAAFLPVLDRTGIVFAHIDEAALAAMNVNELRAFYGTRKQDYSLKADEGEWAFVYPNGAVYRCDPRFDVHEIEAALKERGTPMGTISEALEEIRQGRDAEANSIENMAAWEDTGFVSDLEDGAFKIAGIAGGLGDFVSSLFAGGSKGPPMTRSQVEQIREQREAFAALVRISDCVDRGEALQPADIQSLTATHLDNLRRYGDGYMRKLMEELTISVNGSANATSAVGSARRAFSVALRHLHQVPLLSALRLHPLAGRHVLRGDYRRCSRAPCS